MTKQDKTKMEKANPHKPVNDVRFKAIDMSYKTGLHDGFNKGYTAAMHAHDAEIADLREKCDKLAGAVEAKIWTRDDCVTTVCHHCGGEGPNEYIEHKSGCPVQIAREVQG